MSDPLYGFDHFWSQYPRRNGRRLGRCKCEARWVKMTLEERKAAWRGAVNYARDVAADLTIAKDPDRWLRDRCWEDWDEPVAPDNRQGRNRDPMRGRHSDSLEDVFGRALGVTE